MTTRRKANRTENKAPSDVRRTRAVALALAGKSSRDIAKALGLNHSTASSIVHEPEVAARIAAGQQEIVRDAIECLKAANAAVAARLTRAALGEESIDSVQLGAIRDVLDRTLGKATEHTNVNATVVGALAHDVTISADVLVDAVRRLRGEDDDDV